jgi:hypothetical protein
MKAHTDQSKAPLSNAGPSPDAKDNLQTLPLVEVEKELGSSADGLTQDGVFLSSFRLYRRGTIPT